MGILRRLKITDTVPNLLELFENVAGVRFFEPHVVSTAVANRAV